MGDTKIDKREYGISSFTVNFSHLHYNIIQHVCVTIPNKISVSALHCLASRLDYIIMYCKLIVKWRRITDQVSRVRVSNLKYLDGITL